MGFIVRSRALGEALILRIRMQYHRILRRY
jgi:hypothetical protein